MYKLIDDEVIDQMIVGEGEKAFLELLNGNRDRIVFSKSLGFEELFWPDRDLIMNYRTVDLCEQMIGKRITSFQANRVCPFRCTFCSERVMTGNFHRKNNPIRTRDVRDLMDEIEYVIAKYKLDFFKFADATFDTSTEFVINFCEEKIRRGNNIEWECLIHAGLAEKEMFTSLKHSNCNQVDVGCESGSKKVLREMRKGTTPDQTAKVFEWAREVGIKRRAFFLIGMPSETEEDIELTEKFIEKINPDVLGVTILCPYPGSDLYNHNLMKDVNWSEADEYSNDFWRTDHFTNNDLKNIQKRLTTKSKLAWHHNQIDNS